MIYIISASSIEDYNDKHGTDICVDTELSDEAFIEICENYGGWTIRDWKEFVEVFNSDSDYAPMSSEHYIREIK